MSLRASDFYDFIKEHYRADTMRLYIVSPYELSHVRDILEATLGQVREGGRQFDVPESTYNNVVDTRAEDKNKHQSELKLFFTIPSSIDRRQLMISTLAQNVIAETLSWHLRHRSGCTYSPQFLSMDLTKTQKIVALDVKTRPHQTDDFLGSLLDYALNIDNIPADEIQSEINNLKHQNKGLRQAPDFECGGISFYHQTLNQLMDMDKEREVLDILNVDEVRKKMQEMLGSLSGIHASGAQPNLLPSLNQVKDQLMRATGLDCRKKNPTSPVILPYRPRI